MSARWYAMRAEVSDGCEDSQRFLQGLDAGDGLCVGVLVGGWGYALVGGTPRKSLTATWPEPPPEFLQPFLRGFIDGDGSLYWLSTAITTIPRLEANGTQAFLSNMAVAVQDATGIPVPKSRRYGNIWKLVWTGMYAKCLAAWLYEGCDLCLERKRNIALEFFQWQPKLYRKNHITPKMRELFVHLLPENRL